MMILRIPYLLASVFLLLTFSTGIAFAKDWKSSEYNYEVSASLEKGWVEIARSPVPNAQFHIEKDSGKGVVFMAKKAANNIPVDDLFIKDFERTFRQNGIDTKLRGEKLQIDGVPAYQIITTDRRSSPGNEKLTRTFVAGGFLYVFVCYTVEVTPIESDPEIKEILGSFRFLTKPQSGSALRVGWLVLVLGGIGAGVFIWFKRFVAGEKSTSDDLPKRMLLPIILFSIAAYGLVMAVPKILRAPNFGFALGLVMPSMLLFAAGAIIWWLRQRTALRKTNNGN